jgi:DNA-binding FadR family transcriptional regulator
VYDAVAKRDPTGAREAMTTLIRLALLDTTRDDQKAGTKRAARKKKTKSRVSTG